MTQAAPKWKFHYLSYVATIALGFVFVMLTYQSTVVSNNNTTPQSFPLILSLALPIIFIWLLATLAAVRFKIYTYSIQDSKDGKSLTYIANSLIVLVFYMMVLPMVNSIESLFAGTPYIRLVVALGNHIPVVIALTSVFLLYTGAHKLNALLPSKQYLRRHLILFVIPWIVFCVLFTLNFYRTVPGLPPVNGIPRFVLPPSVLIFTYVIPHIVLWVCGVVSCLHIAEYAKKVAGSIYKSLFRDLCIGVLIVYVCIFLSQLAMISTISYTTVNVGVGLIYALLFLTIVGFIYILRGASKLSRVEDLG